MFCGAGRGRTRLQMLGSRVLRQTFLEEQLPQDEQLLLGFLPLADDESISTMAEAPKASLFQSMALGGLAASFAVNFTHPIVSAAFEEELSKKSE